MDVSLVTGIAERLCTRRTWGTPEYIDNGASAAVYRVETPSGPAALKIYDPAFFEGENSLIEVKRISIQTELKAHGCAELIEVLDAGEIPEDKTWYLLMDFCPWKSLERTLNDVPEDKIHNLLKQLVRAVQFLTSKGLVHRDIKPANVIISPDFDYLKLLDFGVIRKIAHDEGAGTENHQFIATAQYSPPEFLSREEIPGEKGFDAINIYQIGAVLHDLITKTALFAEEKSTKNKFILFKAVTEKMPRVVSASVPPRLIALCLASLDKNPASRASNVKLDDFLADSDSLEILRRRVRGSHSKENTAQSPALAVWSSRIRSWGKEAAQLELETLGAVTMRQGNLPRGHRWKIDFSSADVPIFLDLVTTGEFLSVYVLSTSSAPHNTPVFTIAFDGPDIPETGIPGALAAQYLYALDLALVARADQVSSTSDSGVSP